MSFVDHPLRERVVSEMHMRRTPPLQAPTLMLQVVRLVDASERDDERAYVEKMPGVHADKVLIRNRHIGGERDDGASFLWERHSEATTATVILPRSTDNPFETSEVDEAAIEWLTSAPGGAIRAVRIGIVKDEATAEAIIDSLGFSAPELVSCHIAGVRIWTDFLVRADNFGRLLVAANGMVPADLGRLVQQIQELGNYRNLALLGLPLAQSEAPRVAELENELVAIAGRMAQGEADANLLDKLCTLSANVSAITAETAFRMSATAAYAQITNDRLDALKAEGLAGFQTLQEFTDRRFLPATRTCASFVARLEALSVRIERSTSLLRTRVEMTLQTQNSDLLRSMDTNAARQLRLQHLVEGLSVVAVSYYALSLISYPLRALAIETHIRYEYLVAASVLPVVGLVWLYLRRRVQQINNPSDSK
ncbi:MAG: DUF3422 family protein [Sphingomonadaceae bacterium]